MSDILNQKQAFVVTFYAFKGGTGRTLALANVGRYLAEHMGYRVGIVDLDLDSPGVPHQELCNGLEHGSPQRESLQRKIDHSSGFVDLFMRLWSANKEFAEKERIEPHELHFSDTGGDSVKMSHYALPLPSPRQNGTVVVMPSAKESVSHGAAFRSALTEFTHAVSTSPANDGQSSPLVSAIASRVLSEFIDHYSLDYVLIDGRTGLGAFSPVYSQDVPHALVLMVGLNDQNIKGSLDILKTECEGTKTEEDGLRPAGVVPVFIAVGPVPTAESELLERRFRRLEEVLRDKREERDENTDATYLYTMPGVDFRLPYVARATYQETYFLERFSRSPLTQEYKRLARELTLLSPVEDDTGPRIKTMGLDDSPLSSLGRIEDGPVTAAFENVHHEAIRDFFTQVGECQWSLQDKNRRARVSVAGKTVFEAHFFAATDPKAPWECRDGDKPFDFITMPQYKLYEAIENEDWILKDLRKPILDEGNDPLFIDRHYPGWTKSCVVNQKTAALPFSANTPIMCLWDSTISDLCPDYWAAKGVRENAERVFLPSSWQLLKEMVQQGGSMRLSTHGASLYYEWLTFVLSCGQRDLWVDETGAIVRTSLTATADATFSFLKFAEILGADFSESFAWDEMIAAFADQKLSMYFGWTDSFRFERKNQKSYKKLRQVKLHRGKSKVKGDNHLRLAPVPHEVFGHRRVLMANWVTVLSASLEKDKVRLKAVSETLRRFLDPQMQASLLKNGFPSSCGPVVKKQLEVAETRWLDALRESNAKRSHLHWQNYTVFLKCLDFALASGHPVPNSCHFPDWIDAICQALRTLQSDSVKDVEEVRTLFQKVESEFRYLSNPNSTP